MNSESNCRELAQDIQDAIEDFIDYARKITRYTGITSIRLPDVLHVWRQLRRWLRRGRRESARRSKDESVESVATVGFADL